MQGKLERFKVEGLHNLRTIDIPIEDNRLILVGENGTGKSTVANLIYFFLTLQWSRMLEKNFKSIAATLDGIEYSFNRVEIQQIAEHARTRRRKSRIHVSANLRREVDRLIERYSKEEIRLNISQFAAEIGMPEHILFHELMQIEDNFGLDETQAEKIGQLNSSITSYILYLPTYRRIEQDLERILPDLDTDKLRSMRRRMPRRAKGLGYIELVEFGMEDVEYTIEQKTTALKEKVRRDLSDLTGEYLRDVIQGAYRSVHATEFEGFDSARMDNILGRIPSEILPEGDKHTLRNIIQEINTNGTIDDKDRVVAHFLTKLIQLHTKQQQEEKDIRDFVRVCNEGYLSGKEFVYDSISFDVSIIQKNVADESVQLPMQALSSGEKQIVSLFSHLYLADDSSHFVIIDEPELSLSVPWQKRFLPDMLERCTGLIAVTHSPFVFDNSLRPYAHSLEEYIVPFEYDPELEENSLFDIDEDGLF